MTAQRDEDIEAFHTVNPDAVGDILDVREAFADGAEYGRKDARKIIARQLRQGLDQGRLHEAVWWLLEEIERDEVRTEAEAQPDLAAALEAHMISREEVRREAIETCARACEPTADTPSELAPGLVAAAGRVRALQKEPWTIAAYLQKALGKGKP